MKKTFFLLFAAVFISLTASAQSVLATSILPNIQDLKNFAGNDQYVYVKGYYTPDDGGGGLFKNEVSNFPENGGTIFNVNGNPTKRWIRLYDASINVKWFGAKGNFHDDDTDAIQNAIYESQYKGKIVYLPKGEYRTTKSLKIDTRLERIIEGDTTKIIRRLRIIGEEKTRTSIQADFNGVIFDLKMVPDSDTIQNMVIKDMTLITVNPSTNLVTGIQISENQGALIENLIFRDLRYDIYADHFWSSTIRNCKSLINTTNSNFKNRYRFNTQCNDLLIEGCVLSNSAKNDDYLVVISEPSSSITFMSCTFEFGKGFFIDSRSTKAALTNISFIGCYWEWIQYSAISIHNQANVRGINITNNYFNSITEGTACNRGIDRNRYEPNFAIVLGGAKGMSITDSYFTNWWKNPIYSAGFAEGININMCTWKTIENIRVADANICSNNPSIIANPDYPIINSIPLNSQVFNPTSERGNYGGSSLLSSITSSKSDKISLASPPKNGNWIQGDIIFNTNPVPGNYIGWVYSNNEWLGFGLIQNN
ncbi:glycosyl hydrolase family 28-related protein [Aquimarina algiphila]|uniref:Rhamnogalacturonase A/B/Epimerase-like pectate lyase domain-containing protein n=1 Tax=Aquimarina algiphila TaxID=2047982 RepID=A0A554VG43_9FLAO|nr:glycosyl hydrolase family 28-related protein [Aquimarina algiphila]TSE06343.1 hypothetical protein FOF46_19480 [Aquimarina algiphila]